MGLAKWIIDGTGLVLTIANQISFLIDTDECSIANGGCNPIGVADCLNFPGSFACSCNSGYSLTADKLTCEGKNSTLSDFSKQFLHSRSFYQLKFCARLGFYIIL